MRGMSPKGLVGLALLGWLTLASGGVRAAGDEPPRFEVPAASGGPLMLVVYGDTRFTQREDVVNSVARRALVARRGCHGLWAPFPRQGACTGGSRLWLPGLRLAFQKGHLAAKTWWAQLGSNQ